MSDDAYLRCCRCGWSYPIETTDEREACGECGGTLMIATDRDPKPTLSAPERRA